MQKNHGHEYEGLGAPKPPWRISLAGRKTGLYRPDLPTLRRMNMDDEASKLPNEHCRNTTTCTADDFANSSFTLFDHPKQTHAALLFNYAGGSLTVSDKFSPDRKRYTIPSIHIEKPWSHYKPLITKASKDWSQFVSECGEFVLPKRDFNDVHFSGYAVRYLKPNITQSWKYHLHSEPSVSKYDQKPVPYETWNRYRRLSSPFSRTSFQQPWY
ncbi:sperm microtubule inner protein 8-like isoform X2 [Chiloscyllium punctatum]|uniref:sperm microtubule inner protein 8-like isoform X2 n=1 Tax=Chiloscyllium punctatum TaxID=137246 RepID=UPI003B636F40